MKDDNLNVISSFENYNNDFFDENLTNAQLKYYSRDSQGLIVSKFRNLDF
jgi:hypothetical protein